MIDDLTDDFDKYVTPATPKRQREFRTDRNNNPIAAAVATGGKNQFTNALDQAEIPWEHGDPFRNNPRLSTIRIKGDPYEGARAILSNSNALKWYRATTGKTVLPKYGVRSSEDFTKLPIDHQNEIINGIYQSEGGNGKIRPAQDDFDKYVSSSGSQLQATQSSDDEFDKYAIQPAQGRGAAMARASQVPPPASLRGTRTRPMVRKPFADVNAGASGSKPVTWQSGGAVGAGVAATLPLAPSTGMGDVRMAEGREGQREQLVQKYKAELQKADAPMELGFVPGPDPRTFDKYAEEAGRRADEELATQRRLQTPEVIAGRKEMGRMPAWERTYGAPALRVAGGLLKTLGGVPLQNEITDYLNKKGTYLEDVSSSPLNEQGEAIVRSVPEKVGTSLADLGFSVIQIAAIQKATGLPMSRIMAIESALKSSDKPVKDRAVDVAQAYGMGKILDQHLSRPASAVLFGAPTALQTGAAVAKGNMTLGDALLETGVQTGAGAILGGKPKELPNLGSSKPASIAPVISEARAERVRAATEGAQALTTIDPKLARTALGTAIAERGVDESRNMDTAPTEVATKDRENVSSRAVNANPQIQSRQGEPSSATVRGTEPVSAIDASAATNSDLGRENVSKGGVGAGTPRHVDLQIRRQRGEGKGQFKSETTAQAEERRAKVGQAISASSESGVDIRQLEDVMESRRAEWMKATESERQINEQIRNGATGLGRERLKARNTKAVAHASYVKARNRLAESRYGKGESYDLTYKSGGQKFSETVKGDLGVADRRARELIRSGMADGDVNGWHGPTNDDAGASAFVMTASQAGELNLKNITPTKDQVRLREDKISGGRVVDVTPQVEVEGGVSVPRQRSTWLDEYRQSDIIDYLRQPEGYNPNSQPESQEAPKTTTSDKANPDSAAAPETPKEPSTTSAHKAKVDEERAARGAEELPWSPKTKSDEELLATAKKANALKPYEAQQLTQSVLKKPRALSDLETVQIDLHKQELVNDHNQLLREIVDVDNSEDLAAKSARLDAIEREWDDTDRVWRLSGTEKGRSLRSQQITINQNYELLPMKARMKAATGETKLPPEAEAKIEAQQKRIAELEERWKKRVTAKEEKARTESVNKIIIEKKIEIRRAGRRRAHDELVKERADIKQQVVQAWAKMKPKSTTLSMGGLGDIDPEGELSRALGNLARNYIEDGVIKAADLVDSIHEQIKDVTGLTKRQVSDLISGYGRIREPTHDPIETKLNEVKSILASTSGTADVLEKGIRPLRRGQQREKPTEDQRRALRELEDAMREKGPELAKRPYDVKTEQSTPLDKAKTTARNRQEQLRKWIADGKREVQGRQQVIPDAELNHLETENAALEKVVALLDDPVTDLKAVERRMADLQKIIIRQRSNIQSGKGSPDAKEGAKSVWSPEIGAMEKERRALTSIANDMRSDAARKAKEAEASKPIGVYGVQGSWADFEVRAKKALAARKRFEKQIAEYQQRRKAGDFEKKPKAEPLVHDADTERLRLEMNREKRKFDADVFNAKVRKEWNERPLWSKGMAYGAGFVRANVLSGVKTIGKIGSALAQRTVQQYGEEGLARVAKPLVRGTAEKATRYGGHMNVASEKEFAKGFGAGVKEISDIIRTGESELSRRFNDHYPGIPTKLGRALEVPGRFHFAEKNPLMRGEFERYKELALQEAERISPGARNNPAVIDAIEERAYKSAKEVILMGDNPFSRVITDAQRRLSLAQKDMVRTIVPVHRVAGNYLNQAINEYGLGIFRGAIRAIHERNPDALAKLTPEEADKTMRLIQRGTLGVIYMALAGTGIGGVAGVKFGGFYKRGRKDEVQPQDIKVGRVTIPHWALHSPPDELAQLIASMKQEWDEGKQREETRGQRFASGAARSTKGVLRQTPFVNELTQITNSLDSGDSLAGWAGRFVASRVEPQIVQETARTTDRYQGQDVKRKPRGFTDALKMGLPGARQTVPISPVFGSKASKASSEVQRLDMTLNGAVKKPDESRQEFADRQVLVNGYIRRALEKEVAKSDYQQDLDPNRIERLKQVKEAAEKEGQAAYDAVPRPQKFKKQKQVYPAPSGAPQSRWLPQRNPFKSGSEAFKA